MLIRSTIYRGSHPDRIMSCGSTGERGVCLVTLNDGRMFTFTAVRPQARTPWIGAELGEFTAAAGWVVTPWSTLYRRAIIGSDAAHVMRGDRLTVRAHHTGRGYQVDWDARDGRTYVGAVGECDGARVHRTERAARAWAARFIGVKAVRA